MAKTEYFVYLQHTVTQHMHYQSLMHMLFFLSSCILDLDLVLMNMVILTHRRDGEDPY